MAKIRQDFVTNSSSASFTVVFKTTTTTAIEDLFFVVTGKYPPATIYAQMKSTLMHHYGNVSLELVRADDYEPMYRAVCETSMDNYAWGDFNETFEKFVALLQRRCVANTEAYVDLGFYGKDGYRNVQVKLVNLEIEDTH